MFWALKYTLLTLLLLLIGCSSRNRARTLKIMGSDSEVNLVLHLAEAYAEKDSITSIGIIGGGSGMGIASLINGKAHIANSSRGLTASETKLSDERALHLQKIIFAKDAIAFVVHQINFIDTLSLAAVTTIFTGNHNRWDAVNSSMPNKMITRYGRQTNSGTYLYVKESILKAPYSNKLLGLNGNAQIIEAIRQDPWGIGYVSAGYLSDHSALNKDIKVLWIKEDEASEAFSPLDIKAVVNSDYPIVRPLIQFIPAASKAAAKRFIEFELSAEGQKVIAEHGYFALSEKERLASLNLLLSLDATTQR